MHNNSIPSSSSTDIFNADWVSFFAEVEDEYERIGVPLFGHQKEVLVTLAGEAYKAFYAQQQSATRGKLGSAILKGIGSGGMYAVFGERSPDFSSEQLQKWMSQAVLKVLDRKSVELN